MSSRPRLRLQPDHRLAFLSGFLKRPGQVGSIIPSSRYLERRIVRLAEVTRARVIVELGPGTGGTTRALLRAMAPDARLLAIEINARFADLLAREGDRRLSVHRTSATKLASVLASQGHAAADVILSGIPFSTMTRDVGRQILRAAHDALAPGGLFVAYQVRDRVRDLGNEVFGRARVQTEILNVPPMRIFRWRKPAHSEAASPDSPRLI